MGNNMYVDLDSLKELRGELSEALGRFNKSFNDLEQGVIALTSKDFIGGGSQIFKEKFESQTKPTLEEVKKDTNNAIEYMDNQVVRFNSTLDRVDEISSGR